MDENSTQLFKAERALSGGNLDEAQHLCGALLKQAEPDPRALLLMGVILNRRGDPQAALPYLERSMAADPNSPDVLLWMSRTVKRLGRGNEALDLAMKADRTKPSDPAILHQLGSCQMDCELFADAVESYRKAIVLDRAAAVLYYRLGLALLNAGDPAEAANAFRECLRLDPTSATVKAALDTAENALRSRRGRDDLIAIDQALAKGAMEEAEKLCRSSIRANPSDPELQFRMGSVLLIQGRCESASEWLQKVWEANSSNSAAAIQLAYALQRIGKLEEALPPALAAVQSMPSDPESHVQLGVIYLDMCRYPDAIPPFRRALEINPRHLFAHRALAQALHRAGNSKEEVQVLSQALLLDPESISIRRDLVEARLAMQDTAAALLEAKALALEHPGSIEARCVLAECHLLEYRFDLAESQVSEAVNIPPNNGHEAFRLGTLLQTLGRVDDAIQFVRKSIELEPKQGAAYALLSYLKKTDERDRPRIEIMSQLSTTAALGIGERAELHYGLGKCHEDLKEYEAAMRHFDEANRLTYLHRFGKSKFDLERSANFRDRLMDTLASEFSSDHRSVTLDSSLPIFVFGMIRSGTTLVDQILSSHREVGSVGEDPFWVNHAAEFLDAAPKRMDRDRLREVGLKYLAHLEKLASGKTRMIDKTPANYAFAPLLHLLFPNAKFIHMVRNPADTCLSIYTTMNRVRTNWAHDKETIAYAYRNYETVMECWRKLLPSEAMMEVHYEDLAIDTERVTREIVSFCGLPWDDACLHPESNRRSVLTPSAVQVRRAVYASSVGRWKHYEPWIPEFLLLNKSLDRGGAH